MLTQLPLQPLCLLLSTLLKLFPLLGWVEGWLVLLQVCHCLLQSAFELFCCCLVPQQMVGEPPSPGAWFRSIWRLQLDYDWPVVAWEATMLVCCLQPAAIDQGIREEDIVQAAPRDPGW
jgi:hypothetical protein